MNAIEARVREALHDEAAEVTVTEPDVSRLESEFRAKLDGQPRGHLARGSRRRWQLVVAAAAALTLAAGGWALWQRDDDSALPANPPAQEQPVVPPGLVGLWRQVPNSPYLWEITEEGRFGWTRTAAGYLSGEAVGMTISRRVGDVFTLTSDTDSRCLGDHRIEAMSPTTVTVTILSDTCDVPRGETLRLERVSPGAAAGEALIPLVEAGDLTVVDAMVWLEGTWLHAESGTLLAVDRETVGRSRTYAIDDDGDGSTDPDGRGLMWLGSDGSVQVQPFAQEVAGCTTRFTKVLSDRATLITTSSADSCFPTGSQQNWIRLN